MECHSAIFPMLFKINVKPLGEVITREFGRRCHQCVDDTQLCLTVPLDPKGAMEVLNQCLEAVMGWLRIDKLRLNPNKTRAFLLWSS